jgi:PAS domain S-box-containing protein
MAVFDAITDYIFALDEEGRFVRVNHMFAESYGLHPREMIGKKCSDLLGSGAVCDQLLQQGERPQTFETSIGDKIYQISVFPLRDAGRHLTVHVMKDVTEIMRLKQQLYHSDKLSSLGLLVAGVAHELNNPLTGTIAYTELLKMKVTDEEVLKELGKIQDSAQRCKKIVDNLLTFSRQRTSTKSLESITDVIDRAIALRAYWLTSSNIEVVREYQGQSTVFVDAQQIQQVILNILLNAEHAIAATGRRDGCITFTTKLDRKNRNIIISISDNGTGIPKSDQLRIFDPFFTTKPVGVGTGLGLSISHGIITEHGGTIRVEDAPGSGAKFIIELATDAGKTNA